MHRKSRPRVFRRSADGPASLGGIRPALPFRHRPGRQRIRVRGTVIGLSGQTLKVKTREGEMPT